MHGPWPLIRLNVSSEMYPLFASAAPAEERTHAFLEDRAKRFYGK